MFCYQLLKTVVLVSALNPGFSAILSCDFFSTQMLCTLGNIAAKELKVLKRQHRFHILMFSWKGGDRDNSGFTLKNIYHCSSLKLRIEFLFISYFVVVVALCFSCFPAD